MRFTILGFFAAIAISLNSFETAHCQESDPADPPPASLEDLAWISGHWNGSAIGGQFEESWNPPVGDSMMGMFKFIENGKVKFYELLTIVPKDDSLLLRLKHFDSQLTGWEEKDKSVEFPLVAISESEARFDGLTFKKLDDQQMVITVQTEQEDGSTQELRFECQRAGGSPSTGQSAIEQVMALDSVLSKQRDRLPEKQSLATAIQAYVFGLDNIDFSRCPKDFQKAFKDHRNAWQNTLVFFGKHDQLHGEMHAVIERIRKMDADVVAELDQCMRPVFETWQKVEAAIKAASK